MKLLFKLMFVLVLNRYTFVKLSDFLFDFNTQFYSWLLGTFALSLLGAHCLFEALEWAFSNEVKVKSDIYFNSTKIETLEQFKKEIDKALEERK